jgi:LmbE family N-acetylglucosaminyl deacetylase
VTTILAIAPHPDDETLGAGGTLLRHKAEGDEIHWLIVTATTEAFGWPAAQVKGRERAISAMAEDFGFSSVHQLKLPTARLDTLPLGDIIGAISGIIDHIRPETVYLPFSGDVHSDHRIVFQAVAAATKSFRHPLIRRLLACEIVSETDFSIQPDALPFRPTSFVDISRWLEAKLALLDHFREEMGPFPFPRSAEAIRALAMYRGSQAGVQAAEAFMVLKEIR